MSERYISQHPEVFVAAVVDVLEPSDVPIEVVTLKPLDSGEVTYQVKLRGEDELLTGVVSGLEVPTSAG